MPIVRRPTRSLHRDEAVGRRERGSDWCRDKDEFPRMHSMSSEERKKMERKALKLLAEDGVRHELLWEVPSGHAREKKER